MSRLTFIITAWGERRPKALPVLLAALQYQTFTDWNALIVDSKRVAFDSWKNYVADKRFFHFPEPFCREHTREEMYKASAYIVNSKFAEPLLGEWLAFPNDDCYLAPTFAEKMLDVIIYPDIEPEFVYCNMVAGTAGTPHQYCDTRMECGRIDKCAFIVKKQTFLDLGGAFPEEPHTWVGADGAFAELVYRERPLAVAKVNECLVVHN